MLVWMWVWPNPGTYVPDPSEYAKQNENSNQDTKVPEEDFHSLQTPFMPKESLHHELNSSAKFSASLPGWTGKQIPPASTLGISTKFKKDSLVTSHPNSFKTSAQPESDCSFLQVTEIDNVLEDISEGSCQREAALFLEPV